MGEVRAEVVVVVVDLARSSCRRRGELEAPKKLDVKGSPVLAPVQRLGCARATQLPTSSHANFDIQQPTPCLPAFIIQRDRHDQILYRYTTLRIGSHSLKNTKGEILSKSVPSEDIVHGNRSRSMQDVN